MKMEGRQRLRLGELVCSGYGSELVAPKFDTDVLTKSMGKLVYLIRCNRVCYPEDGDRLQNFHASMNDAEYVKLARSK